MNIIQNWLVTILISHIFSSLDADKYFYHISAFKASLSTNALS